MDYLHISLPPTSLYLDIFSKTVYIYHRYVSYFPFCSIFCTRYKRKKCTKKINEPKRKKRKILGRKRIKCAKIWIEKRFFGSNWKNWKRCPNVVRRLFRPHAFCTKIGDQRNLNCSLVKGKGQHNEKWYAFNWMLCAYLRVLMYSHC